VLLKWPNDVWHWPAGAAPRKLAGILIETASMPLGHASESRWVVVGVGVNLDTPVMDASRRPVQQAALPEPLAPIGWRSVDPQASISEILTTMSAILLDSLLLFQEQGWPAFAATYAQRDALAGREVRLWEGGVAQPVAVLGVAADGGLRVRDARGLETVKINADISVRV
jgi:BirA family transcriptional regulator, biotin operon repressor / biotin---[acetyl-CoA-carboxylase] ligase